MSGGITATTLAYVAIGMSAIGAGVSAYGSYQQGQAQKAQADYQAKVNENNAKLANWQADDSRVRGQEAEANQRRKAGMFLESQKTSLAGQGFDIYDDTGQMVMNDTVTLGEIDAQTIRKNANREAFGYESQAANFMNQSSLSKAAGENAVTSSYINMGSTLFSGASSVAGKWTDYKDKGIF